MWSYIAATGEIVIVVVQQIKGNEIVWIELKKIQTASHANDNLV